MKVPNEPQSDNDRNLVHAQAQDRSKDVKSTVKAKVEI